MSKLVQLTTNSWLIRAGSASSGLLFRTKEDYLFLSPTGRMNFPDMAAVEKKFGKVEAITRVEEEEVSHIRGYPVKHQGIEILSESPPLYNKGGTVVYAAGYWGLRFTNGWTQAYCPKQKTLEEYDNVGPFSNRLEMLNHLSTLNTQNNLKAIG